MKDLLRDIWGGVLGFFIVVVLFMFIVRVALPFVLGTMP